MIRRPLTALIGAGSCLALALGAVAVAFLGAEKSGALLAEPPFRAFGFALALVLAWLSMRAAFRHCGVSALLHGGGLLILLGGLLAGSGKTRVGYLPVIEGSSQSMLYDSSLLDPLGEAPFSVQLDRFAITYYDPSRCEETPAVREYRSEVTLWRPGREPLAGVIRVNHPLRIDGVWLYQMSWGEEVIDGKRIRYSMLMAVRDKGLPWVFAGFFLVCLGALLQAWLALLSARRDL